MAYTATCVSTGKCASVQLNPVRLGSTRSLHYIGSGRRFGSFGEHFPLHMIVCSYNYTCLQLEVNVTRHTHTHTMRDDRIAHIRTQTIHMNGFNWIRPNLGPIHANSKQSETACGAKGMPFSLSVIKFIAKWSCSIGKISFGFA